jgi:hypothetical protein
MIESPAVAEKDNAKSPLLDRLQENWNLLAPVAGWIVSIIGSFLNPPPTGTNFKAFLYVLIVLWTALMLFFLYRWRQGSDAHRWGIATFVSFVLVCISVVWYFHLENTWTASVGGRSIIVGKEYTDRARAWIENHPDLPVEELIADFGGEKNVEMIWTKHSLDLRRTLMGALYLLCGTLLTTAVMAGTQLVYCVRRSGEGGGIAS